LDKINRYEREIADPTLDQIVIAGENIQKRNFKDEIMKLASVTSWKNKVTVVGFLPATDIGELLAVADAVIRPDIFMGIDRFYSFRMES
jgi:hypothetical protein